MRAAKWNQTQTGKFFRVSGAMISMLRSGKRDWTAAYVRRLACLEGVYSNELGLEQALADLKRAYQKHGVFSVAAKQAERAIAVYEHAIAARQARQQRPEDLRA